MKVVILAGGLGTRPSEETSVRPKPMVEIGGRPILWQITKGYAAAGFDELVVCCGYKGYDDLAVTYGDAVSDVDVAELVELHHAQGRLATVTAVRPPARFGALDLEGNAVWTFEEKPTDGDAWINGGFFVCNREVLGYIDGDGTLFEREPLERLAKDGELSAYRHRGFWHPMGTLRDRTTLGQHWASGDAPWRRW